MVERTTPKEPIELAWDEYVASMEGRLYGQTDAFKFAWKAAKRTWVGLTDKDKDVSHLAYSGSSIDYMDGYECGMEAAENILKEKNSA